MSKKKLAIILLLIMAAIIFTSRVLSAPTREILAYQLVIDGEELFVLEDKDQLEAMLSEYQQEYLFREIPEDAGSVKIGFLQEVEILEVKVAPDLPVTFEEALEKIYTKKEEAMIVEVERGDVFSTLVNKYGISVAEGKRLNPGLNPDRIFPGDKIVINPFKPSLDVTTEFEQTAVEAVAFKIVSESDSSMLRSQSKILKKGIAGEKEVVYNIRAVNGLIEDKEVLEEKIIKEPVEQLQKVGTKKTASRGGKISYGVVNGSRISSPFGNRIHPITRVKSVHTGVDLAAPHGNTVYSYADGTVSFAGWNGGYGNIIYINHGNGLQTRYAHLSQINVKVGQKVVVGQSIGKVGSTGTATGPHLHFEVRINGVAKNPLNYI